MNQHQHQHVPHVHTEIMVPVCINHHGSLMTALGDYIRKADSNELMFLRDAGIAWNQVFYRTIPVQQILARCPKLSAQIWPAI